jgi:hypothetical protein
METALGSPVNKWLRSPEGFPEPGETLKSYGFIKRRTPGKMAIRQWDADTVLPKKAPHLRGFFL